MNREHSLILYDGMCGLCNATVDFLIRHDRQDRLRFASLQSPTGRAIVTRHGGNPEALSTIYLVSEYDQIGETVRIRGKAVFYALRALGGAWVVPAVLRWLPAFVLDLGYKLIARVRYRIWGRLDACRVPTPETRAKFIDA